MLLKDLLIAVIVSVYVLVRKDKFAAQTKKITYSIFSTRIADFWWRRPAVLTAS